MRGIRYTGTPAIYLLFGTIFILWICSCTREESSGYGGEAEVTLVLNTRSTVPASRADLAENESFINTIEVLVFEAGGKYLYTALGRDITNPISESAKRSFNVTLKKDDGPYDLVILANSREWIGNSFTGGIPAGTPRATVFQNLIAEHSDLWNCDPASPSFKYMPMWGEIESITIEEGMEPARVSMIRLMSKVDIFLNPAVNNFTMESAYIYNYNTQASLIPDTGSWNEEFKVFTAPTLPQGSVITEGPLDVGTLGMPLSPGQTFGNKIYLFEAAAGTDDLAKNTCLVIGGKYEGHLSYYRIDFENDSSGTFDYIPLRRNFHYTVEISSVSGPGFPDKEKAFRSQRYGLSYNVKQWDMGKEEKYGTGGQYQLDITETYIPLKSQSGTYSVTVKTTHPKGWSYALSTSASQVAGTVGWIPDIYLSDEPVKDVPVSLTFDYTQNNTGNSRTAYLHITSGNLTNVITIEQEY